MQPCKGRHLLRGDEMKLRSSHRWFSPTTCILLLSACASAGAQQAQTYLNAQMPWHPANLDAQGKVLAWYQPEHNLGYDQFLRLDWGFLEHKVPVDTVTNVKVYLT